MTDTDQLPQKPETAGSTAATCSAICECPRCLRRRVDGLVICHKRAVGNAMIELGKAMRRQRQANGVRMSEAARRAGVSKMFVCDVELGRRLPTSKMLEKIMAAISPNAGADLQPPQKNQKP